MLLKGACEMTQTMSYVQAPLYGCLVAAEEFLGENRSWMPANAQQEWFLGDFASGRMDVARLKDGEFKSMASRQADELNAWMARNGFELRLDPFDADQFGTAAILRILGKWVVPGEEEQLIVGRDVYPAVRMKRGFEVLVANGHPNLILSIPTEDGDVFRLTIADQPETPADLFDLVKKLKGNASPGAHDHYAAALFPMVNYDESMEHEWLRELATVDAEGSDWFIAKAIQQTKLQMNHLGAKAESAAMMVVERMMLMPGDTLTIDKPFALWVERPGCELPLFCAYLAEDVWSNPGTIDLDTRLVP